MEKRPRSQRIVLIILMLAGFGETCAAQASPPSSAAQPLRLTMKEAVQLALKQNPQVVAARLLSLESDRDRQVARSALLPQADLTALAALHQYNFQSVEFVSHPKPAGPFQYVQAGPAFSQTLVNLPLIRSYQIGREGVRESRAQETVTREDVTAAVVTQYLLVLRAIAVRDAAKARVSLAERLYNQAANLQKTGIGLKIDTTRAQVED